MIDDYLPIAVRAYTEWRARTTKDIRTWTPSSHALVIDTETTVDATQRLSFLSYRYLRIDWQEHTTDVACVAEGLAYADDLPRRDPQGLAILREYAGGRGADVVPGVDPHLRLHSRREFVDSVLYPAIYQSRATQVTFNALFDFARLAYDVRPASGRYQGGFSLAIWQYLDEHGQLRENKYRPRLTIKTIDSKRAMKRLTRPRKVETVDIATVESGDGVDKIAVGGDLVDLRQLVYVLTDKSHSLESACRSFGVPYSKRLVRHGKITVEYIDYNREDVWATSELYARVLEEYVQCVPTL